MDNNECGTVYQRVSIHGIRMNEYFVLLDESGDYRRGVCVTVDDALVFVHHGSYSYEIEINTSELTAHWQVCGMACIPGTRVKIVHYLLGLTEIQPGRKDYTLHRAVYTLCNGADDIRVSGTNFRWQPYKGYTQIVVHDI